MNDAKNKSRMVMPNVAIAATILIWLIAILFPQKRLWGINHLAYFSTGYSFFYISLLVLLAFFLSGEILPFRNIISSISAWCKRLPRFLRLTLAGILFIVIFAALKDQTKLLGDGIQRIGELGNNGLDRILNTSAAEPLDFIIHYAAYKFIFLPFGLSAQLCYEVISYLAGLIYVWAAWSIAGQLKSDKISFWLVFLYLLGWGGIVMFFGYAEEYGLAASILLVFIYYSIKHIYKNESVIPIAVVFLFGFFLHNLLLILLPSVFYLVLTGYKTDWKRSFVILTSVMIPLIIWFAISFGKKESGAFLLPASGTEPGYLLWSRAHLIDIFNELFLICPAILILLTLQKIGRMPNDKVNRLRMVIWLSALSGLAVLAFVDPQLGMSRDWDLFALPLLAFHVALFFGVDWSKVGTFLKATVMTIMVGFTLVWVQINATEKLALARYENVLPLDYARGRYGYDRLGFYYVSHKRLPEAEAAYKRANQIKPHPRSLLNQAYVQADLGKKDDAIATFKELLVIEPMQPVALYELGWLYYDTGQYQNALDIFIQFQTTPDGKNNAEIAKAIDKLKSLTGKNMP